jgi:hypothetical protein
MANNAEQERSAFIDGLTELIERMKSAPELPGNAHHTIYTWTEGVGDPAPLFAAAAALGSDVEYEEATGQYKTRKRFGGITYVVLTPQAPKKSGTRVIPNPLVGGE